MTTYITQGRFTAEALKAMMAKPEDRSEAVGKLIEKAGGRLLDYYFTCGEYDFLLVSEGPSTDGAMAASIVAAAIGGVTDVKTYIAMTSGEMKSAFAKAGSIAASFRAAGAR